jgi:L-ribulose-5-phosphate 4-epimerase
MRLNREAEKGLTMDYQILREQAFEANREIMNLRLAQYTWGNVSAFDPDRGVFAIKPSGIAYSALSPEAMVVLDLEGTIAAGTLKPSSDTDTHRILYREFAGIRGITHTHSPYAVAWAQACQSVPVLGTTHADQTVDEIPCTSFLTAEAVKGSYEQETGALIVECLKSQHKDHSTLSMILVAGHGPFTWGESAARSVYHAVVLEEICRMALLTIQINPAVQPLPPYLIHKHWERKNGQAAYYGQGTTEKHEQSAVLS